MAGQESVERNEGKNDNDPVDSDGGPPAPAAADQHQKMADDVDSILDEIDDVLEENAEEFVKQFVQKGGQ